MIVQLYVESNRQVANKPFHILSYQRGDDGGNGMHKLVEVIKRRNMEVRCIQETTWRGDSWARKMAEGYKMLHPGGDGSKV